MGSGVATFGVLNSVLGRVAAARNALIGSRRFRRWALRFPVTRPRARRHTRALVDLCAGFVYSQVLQAAVQLDLQEVLASTGPAPADRIARGIGLEDAAAHTLLRAAASLDLVERHRDGRYALGPLGIVLRDEPGVVAMVRHHAMLYRDLADPVALLRGERATAGELERFWAYARNSDAHALDGERVDAYSDLMARSQAFIAQEVLDAYPVGRHRRMLDVGGGTGAFLSQAANRAPGLELGLFDLPAVADRARRELDARGLGSRLIVTKGNFLLDPLPAGADLITLVRVVHDHDDDAALALLRACRRALTRSGTLLVAEPMADTSAAEPVGDAYFGLYLLAMGSGRPRTAAELGAMLRRAGFERVRSASTHTPLLVRVLVAT